ncbi:MAG: DNA polymerase III subunit alpha [Chthonomonadales bacterium]
MDQPFVHLHVHTPYSFLDGASDIETLVRRTAELGMPALAMTDHDGVAASVKFSAQCAAYGIRPILGAEITMEDGSHLTLLARSRHGYARLCALISSSYAIGGRLTPRLPWESLEDLVTRPLPEGAPHPQDGHDLFCLSGCRKGLVASLVRGHRYEQARAQAQRLRALFGSRSFFIELQDDLTPDAARVCRELADLADALGLQVVATNNVHHLERRDFTAHDILRCIAVGTTIDQVHSERPLNAERFLKPPQEMAALFAWRRDALTATWKIAEQCSTALPDASDVTPRFPVPEGMGSAAQYLRTLTYRGARARYGKVTAAVRDRIEHELRIICELGYADYFLMCWELARWARRQSIRCTGRGSAADSCVAFCLSLTDVDVIRRNLPFARFLAPGKTPDIDLDFPSDRRDEVFRYIIQRYGEDHAASVCIFSTFWAKSAVRDVGKVLGLPQEVLAWLSDHLSHFVSADAIEEAFSRYAELRPHASLIPRFRVLFDLCRRIAGFPRHIGSHSSGVVISRVPLYTIAPLRGSARGITRIWELDKDDAEELGAMKLDVLSLRTLSAMADADAALRPQGASVDAIPYEDGRTFQMLRAGKAVGTFQFESAAQLALAVTLHPRNFEDLVASVALIRPGPIQGRVVQRFVACRNGWMRADTLHPCLAPILAKTYGCIVFQEQVVQVVAQMTGCTEAEADRFRKSISRHAKMGDMDRLRAEFVGKACTRHPELGEDRAHLLFDQIQGWAGYGFTEGHAASFALTGYRTAYLSAHYPAEYYAGLMNHQPMGFYPPNTLAAEARRRGVRILPVEINHSEDKCIPCRFGHAAQPAIRLGFRLVSGLTAEDIAAILEARTLRPFASLLDFGMRVPLHRDRLENLILCGAFDGLHPHRRGLLWRLEDTIGLAASYRAQSGGLAMDLEPPTEAPTPVAWDLEDFSAWEKFLWTWRITGVCAESHVLALLRPHLARQSVLTVREAMRQPGGGCVMVAGLNIRPHRPPTVSGNPVLFTLIEDETGMLQAAVFGDVLDQATPVLLTSAAVIAGGRIQRRGAGVSLQVEQVKPLRLADLM